MICTTRAATDHEITRTARTLHRPRCLESRIQRAYRPAEALLASLPENKRPKQRLHIERLTRALGPNGRKAAAERAKRNRSELPVWSHSAVSVANANSAHRQP